jgi:glutaredoxin
MENRPRSILTLAALVIAVGLASQGLQTLANSRLAASVRSIAHQDDIYMISSTTCPYCSQARVWFSENKIPFSECFIERDEACASQYQALMAPGTPTLIVRGKKLVGFNPRAIQAAFD